VWEEKDPPDAALNHPPCRIRRLIG
jgi:hypothetical protein